MKIQRMRPLTVFWAENPNFIVGICFPAVSPEKRRLSGGGRLLTNPILSQTGWVKYNKNMENQSIDFRLLTTKKEKTPVFSFFVNNLTPPVGRRYSPTADCSAGQRCHAVSLCA
jgi:hypothetical protein